MEKGRGSWKGESAHERVREKWRGGKREKERGERERGWFRADRAYNLQVSEYALCIFGEEAANPWFVRLITERCYICRHMHSQVVRFGQQGTQLVKVVYHLDEVKK